jgi:RNA polymerase sigma-70 factor (ECF subfamily)
MTTESTAVIGARWRPWALPARESDWDALYAAHLPRIYNYFRYRVGDGADAEDLTAITFEKAWRHRARFRRDLGAFTTWLYAIARNVAVDHWRRRRETAPLEDAATLDTGLTPEDAAVRRSDFERLEALLVLLPERERELLSLKYGADMTNRAIAKLTGLSESNVGTILHRTVRQLRAAW